jgi:trans-aconitate 2-methyltransferase
MSDVRWDPDQYARFATQRSRPFADLLARVDARDPRHVADLGCGPGTLTELLADRWPAASVVGVDSSPEMIAQAQRLSRSAQLEFRLGDLRDWQPSAPVDVLLSNATLQWVPGHEGLLGRFVEALAPGGVLAFQVPGNFREPTHRLLADLLESPRWHQRLGDLPRPSSREPADYLDALARLGCEVEAWETTYLHVLAGEDAVVEWMKGTGLRPVLTALETEDRSEFLAAYTAAVRPAYPRRPYGTVLPYRRVFVVARRSAA